MLRLFRTYRSAGIEVPRDVHRAIAAANRARDAGDWDEAAARYARVLERRADLIHLRIQQGHALKEAGRRDEAAAAYREALASAPDDRDASLHLAHMHKLLGDRPAAAELYVALALRDAGDEEAMREARDLLALLPAEARGAMAAALVERIAAIPGEADAAGYPPLAGCALAFDASDLISFFSHSRRPTGIQRVQIEVLTEALHEAARGGRAAGVCCFLDSRDCWVEVPPAALVEVMRLSGAPGPARDPDWQRRRDALHLHLLVADPVEFREGATLVNLGTSWWLHNYFLALRDMQARRGIVYVPMIHDMIPVMLPDLCLEPVVRDFVGWVTGIFDHSTTFIANSEATKRDLLAVATTIGRSLAPDAVEVVRLDALPPSVGEAQGAAALPDVIGGEPFVLFVATIEPRKGHVTAFDAWEQLIERLGPATTPRLVCVGRKGWHHEPILARLEGSPTLREHVVLLADLDEATLAALYEHCLFAIYPSLYEGWGLPVTEALARGKPIITTTSSSLPEAGGAFARYVPIGDAPALADASTRLIVNTEDRVRLAARIRRDFTPRPWATIAADLCAAAGKLGTRPEARRGGRRPTASLDRFHWIGRTLAMSLHRPVENGEGFRSGRGWLALHDWGCRVAEEGGELAFTLPPEARDGRPLIAAVRLVAPSHAGCAFSVGTVQDELAPGERRTALCPLAPGADGTVTIHVAGALPHGTGTRARETTVGVEGFAIHHDEG